MAKYKIIPSSRTIVQSPISIGHKAEKGVEAIEFDVTAWVETYGSGTLTVIMRRWGDAIPYPIALEIDENNKATWTLSDTDTAKAGMAYAQLSYIVGETVVKKSDIYTFRVMDSLTGEGDPPEAYESWLEHLQHLAAEAMAEVLDIEGVVTDKTLTVDGEIADAKAVGDALSALKDQFTEETDQLKADLGALSQGIMSDAVKLELIECLKRIPWKDSDGETHFENLVEALGVAIVDYDILIGKNIALTTLSADQKDVQYFIDSTDNTKRALLFADTGTHCMTLQDSTATTYYPVKIPASVKKIWFDNAKENNFAVNIHIIYYDSTIGGYRRLLTDKVYDTHEIANWKYDDGNGGIWKLDISDYNDGNLFMLGTFAKSHSSTIRTDSEGNQYTQAVQDNEDIDSAISNVVLRMI